MARARLQLWSFVLLGFIVLGAIFWAALKPPQMLPPAKTMPDGETIRVVKVWYSDHLTTPLENPLVQLLPPEISKRLHLRASTLNYGSDNVFIAIETRRTNGTFSNFPMAMPFSVLTGVLMSNNVGDVFRLDGPIIQYNPHGRSNALVEIFETPLVSHLATNLHLHLTRQDMSSPLHTVTADFDVPNPASRTKPAWKAGPLPMTNHSGALDVVFESIKPGEMKQWGTDYTNVIPYSTPSLKFFENGKPSTNWSVSSTSLADQESHLFHGTDGHFSALETRSWIFEIQRPLPVPPENIVTFHDVPILKTGETFSSVTTNFHAVSIRLVDLTRGQIQYYITPTLKDYQIKMSITPVEGTRKGHSIVDTQAGNGGGSMGFGPPIPEDSKTVDITFTFVPLTVREVQFLAHP